MLCGMKMCSTRLVVLLVILPAIQCTKELLDIQEDLMLAPLATMPLRVCNSSVTSNGHLHCCTRECYIQSYDITRLPVLDEYAIECEQDAESVKTCIPITIDLHLIRIRRILEFENRRERRINEKMKSLGERLSPVQLKKRMFKWSSRLVASWILQKMFTKGFELAQPLISSMLSPAAG